MKPGALKIILGAAAAVLLLAVGISIGRGSGKPAVPVAPPAPVSSVSKTVSASATATVSASATAALAEADALHAAGKTTEARAAYQALVASYPESTAAATAQEQLNASALSDYFRLLNDTNSAVYEVKAGDNLTKIAKQFGVMPGLIRSANFLKGDLIRPAQKLKIPKARWTILVDKSQNTLYLKADEQVIRSYRVATGKDGSTPEGTFKILNHLKNPTWYYEGKVVPPDSPDNPLGTRWMGFDKEGYGLHGTTKPEEIGQFATLGCVRMLNADIETLFEFIPAGTEVTIIG